ncbi:hypothetical protein VIGAN_01280100 [Vigna angularis var. angularis]|uniref:Uncharacterized protein n=1 Tax=Vigna angularis var. angularis TaxID=157739 RepID=A0A0S3R3E7_PHAAN|nr:hypothetical protein VIGAN_01280100 [Vigna angularis var. angularis]
MSLLCYCYCYIHYTTSFSSSPLSHLPAPLVSSRSLSSLLPLEPSAPATPSSTSRSPLPFPQLFFYSFRFQFPSR